jgi:putative flippase GtrA
MSASDAVTTRMREVVGHLGGPPTDRAAQQATRYLVVAGCGYLLAVGAAAVLVTIGVAPYADVITVFILNGLFNFAMVRAWAFPPSGRRPAHDLRRFCVVAGVSLGINYGSFALLYSVIDFPSIVSQAAAIAIAAPFGFLANRLWSFRSVE